MVFSLEYANRVRSILLAAGVTGISQNDLHQKTRSRKTATKDLLAILASWQKRRWVDKFADPSDSRRSYYRATQKFVEEWPIVTSVVTEVVMGSEPLT